MKAMILAAGRGERMKALTADTPKALLKVNNQYLIEFSLRALISAGIREVIINVCYQAEKIKRIIGNGTQYGIKIVYSEEDEALETGGGIFKALPLLSESFIVVSCDMICDFDMSTLPKLSRQLAHLVLVDNPIYHPQGDFGLQDHYLTLQQNNYYTFGNIGLYHQNLFEGCTLSKFKLAPLLMKAIQAKQITGEVYKGFWTNVGTPQDLNLVNHYFETYNSV